MNSLDALSQLNPLREPSAISWWPPAIGWWVIFCLVIILMSILLFALFRRYKKQSYRRHAIFALDKLLLESSSQAEYDPFPSKVNVLLKTVALKAYDKKEIATLYGTNWLNFLKLAPGCENSQVSSFVLELYQPEESSFTRNEIYSFARTWIKMHK
tara:strand:+ start:597 stop:1064 length:468 start_codon:yes stop_codon:yes gene_type:complete